MSSCENMLSLAVNCLFYSTEDLRGVRFEGWRRLVSLRDGGLSTLKPRFVLDIEQDGSDL